MNYWLITTEFPPDFGGGIGTYCYHNAHMLTKNGWTVTVFIPNRHSSKTEIVTLLGVRVIYLGVAGKPSFQYLGYDTAIAYEIAEGLLPFLKEEGIPEILESQEYNGIAYFLLQYKHLGYPFFSSLKVLLTIHAPSFVYHEYNKVPGYKLPYYWIGQMEKWCLQAADYINAPSDYIVTETKKHLGLLLKNPIKILPYPYEQDGKSVDFKNDPRSYWCFWGKLTPQKGILPLLDSLKKLWASGWAKEFNVFGGTDHYFHPENTTIQHWIQKKYSSQLKNKKLILHGKVQFKNWKEKTSAGAVIIIPSICDNYPFTVLESLSSGHIVLASMQGGQSELLIHGVNGFLFDHTIPDDLINKIHEIEALPAEKIAAIRKNALITVEEKHNYTFVYEQKKVLYNQLRIFQPVSNVFPLLKHTKQGFPTDHQSEKQLLSVVIPFFNMGKWIEETLDSVIQSSYKELEIIIVDDGSTDKQSIEKLDLLKRKYNFKLITQKNRGLAEARNTGAENAKGQYLAFIDADDKVAPTYFAKAIKILNQKSNVFFVGSWVQYFELSNAIWPAFTPEPPYILYYNTVCSGGLVFKADAFKKSGRNDSTLIYGLEDWESVISLLENNLHGVIIPEPLYFYRIRKASMARSFTNEKLLFSLKYIANKHKGFYAEYANELVNLFNANGPGFKIDNISRDRNNYGLQLRWIPFSTQLKSFVKNNAVLRKLIFKLYPLFKTN